MQCTTCSKKFRLTHPDIVKQYTEYIRNKLPCTFTHRSGIDDRVLRELQMGSDSAQGPSRIAHKIREQYCLEHWHSMASYYSWVLAHMQGKILGAIFPRLMTADDVPKFPSFEDANGPGGKSPSGMLYLDLYFSKPSGTVSFLTKVFVATEAKKRTWYDKEVQIRHGKLLQVDHTFQVNPQCLLA